jgi:glucose/arabinose dehydrogenase
LESRAAAAGKASAWRSRRFEGKPTGSYRTFATLPGTASGPGVAVGKDGALFISADSDTIWRVVRQQ